MPKETWGTCTCKSVKLEPVNIRALTELIHICREIHAELIRDGITNLDGTLTEKGERELKERNNKPPR